VYHIRESERYFKNINFKFIYLNKLTIPPHLSLAVKENEKKIMN